MERQRAKRPPARSKYEMANTPAIPAPTAASNATPETLSEVMDIERQALDRGIAMLDMAIEQTRLMLNSGTFDLKISSHLAWVLKQRADVIAKLRTFGEKVKTQSADLTPEQQRRAIAKFIQSMPDTVVAEFRTLLDARIEDISLIR